QSLASELGSRQEELQNTNQELQEKARLLAHQNVEVERKNQEVEQARQALEDKAKQLALTSKYKSEFLANMSHELRTPLNSLLILSDQLSRNSDGNLSPKQTEFAKTIHSSGTDLLMLINDILDLSKIESGTVAVDVSELRLTDLHNYVERTFRHVAESKGLVFSVQLDPGVPRTMVTDAKRLQQVIKNLLSNAFKFTRRGRVSLEIRSVPPEAFRDDQSLRKADSVLAFVVADTGIGIPLEKQQIIFEAFQQADGSTSRKYGGTGLGLAISREIARLLGGEIHLASTVGRGSTFTLYLPQTLPEPAGARGALPGVPVSALASVEEDDEPSRPSPAAVGDDRERLEAGDRSLLIVENDATFARLLADVAHEAGFKVLVASFGATALALVRQYQPSAVTLDISLPDMEGWRVLERMKSDLETRHVPVTVITTGEDLRRGYALGAFATLGKPVKTREVLRETLDDLMGCVLRTQREIVVVHPEESERLALARLLASDGVRVEVVPRLSGLKGRLDPHRVDLVVLGAGAEDDALDTLGNGDAAALRAIPLIGYGPSEWTARVDALLKSRGSDVALIPVSSPERLVDQCMLRLHRPMWALSEGHRQMLNTLHHGTQALAGHRVLIVDDDIRNIFALTSILERYEMRIVSAETGRGGIELLDKHPDVEVVLMDVMMPEMDGFETMRAIRQDPRFRTLPIIAVTAKAMKGDREKCIEAGASDYLAKPVGSDELVAKMRTWLAR
ncbi:MAG TPA: response regulator, partial [Methylomirabilota bacterium]|nr:response regulator [Methylomirabilota bacterium]